MTTSLIARADNASFRVKDINTVGSSDPSNFARVGDAVLFFADSVSGRELWTSDGTGVGTSLVKNINISGNGISGGFNTTVFDCRYIFPGQSFERGVELWTSDGTTTGTQEIKDINPSGDSNPAFVTEVGGVLYFRADNGQHGTELWKSDGTEIGTVIVKDINPTGDSQPFSLAEFGGMLYFSATDGVAGRELWRSDGTEDGTVMVSDVLPGPDSSSPSDLVGMGDTLFFSANFGEIGRELASSDGNAEGTGLLKDVNPFVPGLVCPDSAPTRLTVSDELVFFTAFNELVGQELWRTDGTSEGTFVLEINDAPFNLIDGNAFPENLFSFNGQVFCHAQDQSGQVDVWTSNGTEEGTIQIIEDASTGEHVVVHGRLYFRAGVGLWTSDGTASGTSLAADPGVSGFSVPRSMIAYNGFILMSAKSNTDDRELWAYNIEPWVESIVPAGTSPTDAGTVDFVVTFSEEVDGVDPSDFELLIDGPLTGAFVSGAVPGPGNTWTVSVNTGQGDGALGLALVDDDSILDTFEGLALVGFGMEVGDFAGEEVYTIDKEAPTVTLATTASNPTTVSPIPVTVAFERDVTGFESGDLVLVNATASSFIGSGASYSFELIPGAFGLVSVQIPADSAEDTGNTGNAPSNLLEVTYASIEGEGEGEGEAQGGDEGEGEGDGEEAPDGEGEGQSDGEGTSEGDGEAPKEGEGEGETINHTADQDGNDIITLSELLRVIQFFNADEIPGNTLGELFCAAGTEDGYTPDPAISTDQSCSPHASDYNPQDWIINLSELLRLIQFFNSAGYAYCPDADPPTEDGYCPLQ